MSPAGSTAILSALPEEQAGLLAQLEDARRHTVASRDFWLGRLQGRPVVLALSRIGKVSASLTASVLIGTWASAALSSRGWPAVWPPA